MGDWGFAVSQKGYDVKNCADRNLVFSSAFQTLKIFNVYSVSTTKPSSGSNYITINHNLGYYAPFLVVYNGSTDLGQGTSYFFTDSRHWDIVSFVRQYTNQLKIEVPDNFDGSNTSTGSTVYFTVYIFLDNFSTIPEKTINTGTTSGSSSNNYGIRISKEGYDVKTCDDDKLIISSSTPTHIVHKKGITTNYEVSHNLGYIPMFLAYYRSNSDNYLTYDIQGSLTTSKLSMCYCGGTEYHYYIIFKNKNN